MTKFSTAQKATPPANDYDVAAWDAFYAENPGYRRSLSAAAADGEQAGDGGEVKPNDGAPAQAGDASDTSGENKDDKGSKLSDSEHKLLSDVMKHKTARREAESERDTLKSELEKFSGVDLERYNAMLQAEKDAQNERLRAEGDFESLRKQMAEQHEQERTTLTSELEAERANSAALLKRIEDMTIGGAFTSSETVAETVYPPAKARALFGSHFEVGENGDVVAYDKPAGQDGRSVMVDSNGNPLGFDAALRKIIDSDPDSDRNWRPKMKPGADSSEASGIKKAEKPAQPTDKILAGVSQMLGGK